MAHSASLHTQPGAAKTASHLPTPGPWFVSGDGSCWTLVRAGNAADGMRVASTFASHAGQSSPEARLARIRQNEANARLISAAPDLLAVVQRMNAQGGHGLQEHEDMRAAIAKATGQ